MSKRKDLSEMNKTELKAFQREVEAYYSEHGWRGTLSHFKLSPKQAGPLLEKARAKQAAEKDKEKAAKKAARAAKKAEKNKSVKKKAKSPARSLGAAVAQAKGVRKPPKKTDSVPKKRGRKPKAAANGEHPVFDALLTDYKSKMYNGNSVADAILKMAIDMGKL